jgi:hypothetical protein
MLAALLVGFIWGFSEGIWFFIIPDIALSFFAIYGWKKALASTFGTILGAMLAATLLFLLFSMFPSMQTKIISLWQSLPGFYPKMLSVASTHLHEQQGRGLVLGPNSGIPYRFYILEAFKQGITLSDLMLWTPLARIERIAIAPIAVLILKFLLKKKFSEKWVNRFLVIVLVFYWIGIYIWYWGFFLPKTY